MRQYSEQVCRAKTASVCLVRTADAYTIPLYDRMPLCFCHTCTLGGRCRQGSIQSATTVREHKHFEKIRDLRRYTTGHRTQAFQDWSSPQYQQPHRRDFPLHTAFNTDMDLRAVLDRVRGHILGFQLPAELVFAHPPLTAESVYPTTRQSNSWHVGPSSLDVSAPQNALILEHIQAIESTNAQIPCLLSRLGDSPTTLVILSRVLSAELARLEAFREAMWKKQLDYVSSVTSSPRHDSINDPIICNTHTFPFRAFSTPRS